MTIFMIRVKASSIEHDSCFQCAWTNRKAAQRYVDENGNSSWEVVEAPLYDGSEQA